MFLTRKKTDPIIKIFHPSIVFGIPPFDVIN